MSNLAASPRGVGVPVVGVNFGVAVAASRVAVGGKVGLGGIGVADGGGSVGGAWVARGDGCSVGSASVGSGSSVGGLSRVLPAALNSRALVPELTSMTISTPAANKDKRPIMGFRVLFGIVFPLVKKWPGSGGNWRMVWIMLPVAHH